MRLNIANDIEPTVMQFLKSQNILLILVLFLINSALGNAKNFTGEPGFVLIGDVNNRRDPVSGCGRVAYPFEISVYEVTNAQYVKFLNSVARYHDKYGLYSPLSEQHFHGGILRSQEDNIYSYTAKKGYAKLPVTFVSWYDAVRYINWLHYGQPDSGYATLGTTEGTAETGAYNTGDFDNSTRAKYSAQRRNKDAAYWLPSCDEWVKAGFYNPADSGRYYKYATKSNTLPVSSNPADNPEGANYYDGKWAAPFPHLTEVGSYKHSPGPYGTFDQAGNVMEWVEDGEGKSRSALGGSVFMYSFSLERDYRDGEFPEEKLSTFGFRVGRAVGGKVETVNISPAPENIEQKNQPPENEKYYKGTYVRIGHANNKADPYMDDQNPILGLGHVHYAFELSKYSVTNEEYAEFLNGVAVEADPFGLYHPDMDTGVLGGIVRIRRDRGYNYVVKDGYAKKPATYISWYRAARLANYYHYGKLATGRSELGTTEGTETQGAYDTQHFPSLDNPDAVQYNLLPETRNIGARYWLPSNNEWYKAVYYDPSKFGRKYWNYPTRSDNPPNNLPPPGDNNSANYMRETLAVGPPFYLTDVDAYPESISYFGISGAGGQVWEWLEDWRNKGLGDCWRCNEWTKGLRGGSYGYTFRGLSGMNRDPGNPSHNYSVYGVRLARAIDADGWQPVAFYIYWGERIKSFLVTSWFDKRARSFTIFGVFLIFSLSLFIGIVSRFIYVKMKK